MRKNSDPDKAIQQAFAAIENRHAEKLILGSMPSEASLQAQQYYAHARNAFWPIICTLFDRQAETYAQRVELLLNQRIALWDVLQSCHRPGSLDAKIDMASIRVNDFNCFFSEHPGIKQVFFNGAMAEKIYTKYVMPELEKQFLYLQYHRLPSTSPAHAAMNRAQKLQAWQMIRVE